ncbi:integrin-linked kinase-associated serine/threonine phosphatase 2C isoform X2 [Petromyzon marinus]|uniref:Integrin-linked kinase-associated serine/threonine phosphatase 2C isoform X2 n=1 Tax=Petromyzon marinus TaxID=7757 RepID=A0AAJ7UFE4_PETMA|nr:integrin-linked kinase-associated serine/threonine phosphatase 2C isoform X2 [Petromyzon marinus]
MDLFGDLPEPAAEGAKEPPAAEDAEPREDQRGAKRKAEPNADDHDEPEPHTEPALLELRAFVSERRGERDEMQDAHTVIPSLTERLPRGVSRLAYFAVFDGHGGSRASSFAARHLHQQLLLCLPQGAVSDLDKEIRRSLRDAFKQTDAAFLKLASSQKPVWKDGTTAICALIVDNVAYVANLGDSRAVLCRAAALPGSQAVLAVPLSREHSAVQYEERMRLQRAGATVRDGRVLGVLEVSRSIGDGQYKRCGVISTPDIRRCQLTANDRFLLLACDGLFKAFTADEAVSFINKSLEVPEGSSSSSSSSSSARAERWASSCVRVTTEAVRRGSADNVTAVLVQLHSPPQ